MRPVVVRRVDHGAQRRQTVPEPPPGAVLDDDVVLLDPARRVVVGFQLRLGASVAPWKWLRERLEGMVWRDTSLSPRGGSRLSGMVAPHKVFGYLPPQVLRNRYTCQVSDLARDDPELHGRLGLLGVQAWAHTLALMPGPAALHARAVGSAIAPVWRLEGGQWTSGIVNRNNALPYHRDSGNLPGCLSAMVCLRRGAHGGALHLPAYDVWLGIPDRSLTVFSGQDVLHGVSPITYDRHGRRFTAVYYVRRGLSVGAPTAEAELARARLSATSHDQPPA